MIEAVNSVVSNATLVRGAAEQQSVTRSFAANPERVQEIPKAPFISPYIRVDTNFNKAVLQIRDSDTGDVIRQFPSESQLEAYRRAQASTARSQQQSTQASAGDDVPAPQSTPDFVPRVSLESRSAPAPTTTPTNTQTAPVAAAPAPSVDTQA